MGFIIYDTRERRKVPFEPLEPGVVRFYTCGPTVYAPAHIGNFRTYMFEDLLRRTLKYLGYRVVQVMNITDVDDKTIAEANARKVSLREVTAPVIERFMADLKTLNIEPAEHYPRATEHIPEMIELVRTLLDKKFAYIADGSVYFRVASFPEYGGLSGMELNRLRCGVRVDADEYEKDDVRDFALWKGWTEEDGEVAWDAPFGRGRPGWHIECSAMSMKYLGTEFDIHTGGVDNIFPHHENEIAQSVAATGKGFARHWMHSAHLIVEGEKMAKSLGNFYCLKDLLDKGYSARAIRYVLLTTHYRQRLNFTAELVSAALSSLLRLDTLRNAVEAALANGYPGGVRAELREAVHRARDDFRTALEDDLNISRALAALFGLVSAVHTAAGKDRLNREEAEYLRAFWHGADEVLGFLFPVQVRFPAEVVELARERLRARRAKDYAHADEMRDRLIERGYKVEDLPDGTSAITGLEGRRIVSEDGRNS